MLIVAFSQVDEHLGQRFAFLGIEFATAAFYFVEEKFEIPEQRGCPALWGLRHS